jgi:hypothetical protein
LSGPIRCSEALYVQDAITVNDAEGQTGNALFVHLRLDVSVDCCDVGGTVGGRGGRGDRGGRGQVQRDAKTGGGDTHCANDASPRLLRGR